MSNKYNTHKHTNNIWPKYCASKGQGPGLLQRRSLEVVAAGLMDMPSNDHNNDDSRTTDEMIAWR